MHLTNKDKMFLATLSDEDYEKFLLQQGMSQMLGVLGIADPHDSEQVESLLAVHSAEQSIEELTKQHRETVAALAKAQGSDKVASLGRQERTVRDKLNSARAELNEKTDAHIALIGDKLKEPLRERFDKYRQAGHKLIADEVD